MNLTQIKDKIVNIKIKLPKFPKINNRIAKSFKIATALAIPLVLAVSVNAQTPKAEAQSTELITAMPYKLEENILNTKVTGQAKIVVGESEAERVEREANESQTKLASAKTVAVSTVSVEGEPSLEEKRAIVQEVASKYGIDWKLLEAVWQVESGKRWNTSAVSSAGALGPMQFVKGTWGAYGVDGNGDGVADVFNPVDALHGGANYLAANGANQGDIDGALFHYNHSSAYVAKVKSIMASI